MSFDDVVSQPHITSTLAHQVAEGKTAHAYLFTGSRGTGKTTCARILAKAVNCLNPKEGKPCLECEICKAADAGTLTDIIEIDGASNTGIDDIRDLRESAIYMPERCRYKVYIIDEVHMISTQAFNALLKIMEEPPDHVKFILATTEAYKVPVTIVSRCQRFDFRRIREEDIINRLMYISSQEKIDLERDAAALIARLADGAMRDALSLLDQCVAYSDHIDPDAVSNAAGIAGREYLFDLLDNFSDGDTATAISTVDLLYSKSKDMSRLCDELLMQVRNLMLIKTVPDRPELISCVGREYDRLNGLAKKMSLSEILQKLQILSSCAETLPRAVSKRTELEMAIIRLCSIPRTESSGDVSALERRIARLESELDCLRKGVPQKSSGKTVDSPSVPKNQAPTPTVASQSAESEPAKSDTTPAADPEPCKNWDVILDRLTEINPGCAGALKGSTAYIKGDRLMILVQGEFALGVFKQPGNAASLKKAALEVTGETYTILAKCLKTEAAAEDPIQNLINKAKNADIPVDIS